MRAAQIEHPQHDFLAGQIAEHTKVQARLCSFDRNLSSMAVGKTRQEGVAAGLFPGHHRGITKAQRHHGRHGDAFERTVDKGPLSPCIAACLPCPHGYGSGLSQD
jgi:hypothetical protein